MALIKCPECQKDMSDTLDACPHCGFKKIKEVETVKPTANNTVCSNCGKQYYIGANKCPYCKTQNQNKVNPFSGNKGSKTTSENIGSFLGKVVKKGITITKTYPQQVLIGCIIVAIIVGGYYSINYYIDNSPSKKAATVFINSFDNSVNRVNDALESFNLLQADDLAKAGLLNVNVPAGNYFKANGITDENDVKYFGGTYKKKIEELKKLSEEISIALSALNNLKEIDKTKVTNEKVLKAYSVSFEIAKAKEKQNNLDMANKDKVEKMFESFIRNYGWAHEVKDALVRKYNFKVTDSSFVKNEYGTNLRYIISGAYSYNGSNFYVTCEIENTSSGGGFNYLVRVN